MDGHAGFGSREFELALLDDMYDQARSRTEAALRALGATREQATQAKERRRTRSPWSFGDYAAVLGAPLSRRPHAGGGHRLRWPVSVWPELCFEVVEFPGTTLMNEGLNRRDEARAPRLETIEDIKTWAVTLQETEQQFGPLRHADGFHMSWLFKTWKRQIPLGMLTPTGRASCGGWCSTSANSTRREGFRHHRPPTLDQRH